MKRLFWSHWLVTYYNISFTFTQGNFLAGTQLYDLSFHRHGCCCWCKKSIAIYAYNQWVISLDMKTKVGRHVPRINISIWHMTHDSMTNNNFWAYTALALHMKTKVVVTVTDSHSHRHFWFPVVVKNIWLFYWDSFEINKNQSGPPCFWQIRFTG